MLKIICIGALLAMAPPALAQTADGAAVTKTEKPKKTCRRSGNTGTRLPAETICHTADEWARYDKANEDSTQRMVNGQRSMERTTARSGPQ